MNRHELSTGPLFATVIQLGDAQPPESANSLAARSNSEAAADDDDPDSEVEQATFLVGAAFSKSNTVFSDLINTYKRAPIMMVRAALIKFRLARQLAWNKIRPAEGSEFVANF